MADWEHIADVAKAVKIPVFSNGNIQYFADVGRCIESTGTQGVMTAEGNLYNPAIFDEQYKDQPPKCWEMCTEYLDLVDEYPCPLSYSRGHVFKMLHHVLQIPANFDVREMIAKGKSVQAFRDAVAAIKARYESEPDNVRVDGLRHPPWICQPYVRPPPEDYVKKMAEINEKEKQKKRPSPTAGDDDQQQQLSKRKQKKLERNPKLKIGGQRENIPICTLCPNPCGLKCEYKICRKCCKEKCFKEELDCFGHKIQVKSKRRAARKAAKKGERNE